MDIGNSVRAEFVGLFAVSVVSPASFHVPRAAFRWQHPGGKKMLLSVAGKDATKSFEQFHAVDRVLVRWGAALEIGEVVSALGGLIEKNQKKVNTKLFRKQGEHFGDLLPFADPMWYQDWWAQEPFTFTMLLTASMTQKVLTLLQRIPLPPRKMGPRNPQLLPRPARRRLVRKRRDPFIRRQSMGPAWNDRNRDAQRSIFVSPPRLPGSCRPRSPQNRRIPPPLPLARTASVKPRNWTGEQHRTSANC